MSQTPTPTSRKRLSVMDAALVAASVVFVAAATLGGLPGGVRPDSSTVTASVE